MPKTKPVKVKSYTFAKFKKLAEKEERKNRKEMLAFFVEMYVQLHLANASCRPDQMAKSEFTLTESELITLLNNLDSDWRRLTSRFI